MLFNTVALFSTFALAVASVVSAVPAPTEKTVAIRDVGADGVVFCLLLPRRLGGNIAKNENRAITSLHPDFIVTSHYKTGPNDRYVQITGRFDRDKFELDRHDKGGQNDPKTPNGAKCEGYPYFVQLIEPDVQHYCLRCCKHKSDCPTNKSTKGCRKVIHGDYS
ncbi:hypothetical protein BGZ82_003899 [Podila clonocystis]|nr:hypothetical protein BGZ82_003899 [Podila clonocystis]